MIRTEKYDKNWENMIRIEKYDENREIMKAYIGENWEILEK